MTTAAQHTHSFKDTLASARTQTGASLLELSEARPVLVVFLRFSGCPFCLEAMDDIQKHRGELESRGVSIAFVHMMNESEARPFFEANGVDDLPRISDADQSLYRAFGLKRGSLWQIMGPYVWWRLLQAVRIGRRVGRAVGDMRQMPGAFLIDRGRMIASYRHRSQASRPDYVALACSRPSLTTGDGGGSAA